MHVPFLRQILATTIFQMQCSHIKVAELNTLSVGKGITGIPSTVFYWDGKYKWKHKFTWISWCQRSVAVGDIATEVLSVSLESPLTSNIRIKLIHIAARAQSYRKMFVFNKPHGHKTITKPSKSSSESESSVHCCHAAVKTRQNMKEWGNKLHICERHGQRHRM